MTDCQFYGLHAAGHHLTSLLIHVATVVCLFLVLVEMTGAVWRSAFAVALFALHPLRVESVVWVAERKDVLSGLFFVLTMAAYVRYVRRPGTPRYALVVLSFAFGIMCKPMLVTVPLILLLLDFWPLQRAIPVKKLAIEKLPMFALSAVACIVTILAQSKALQTTKAFPLPIRVENAMAAYVAYVIQMVFPARLSVFYPYPRDGFPVLELGFAAIVLAGISAIAILLRRAQPWLLFGWAWYVVMLLPVIGIIQVGEQSHADRYTYLPQIGVCVAAVWLAADRAVQWKISNAALGALMFLVLIALTICTSKQISNWHNSETLWSHDLACVPDNSLARNNLGLAYFQAGRADEAIPQYQAALKIDPEFAKAHNNLGLAYSQQGQLDDAILQFQKALQNSPDDAEAHNNLGMSFFQQGQMDNAVFQYTEALKLEPDFAEAHNNLGLAYAQQGQLSAAISQFQTLLQTEPGNAQTRANLGLALFQEGRPDEAISQYHKALEIAPESAIIHMNLGVALLRQDIADQAALEFKKALEINPNLPQAREYLSKALLDERKDR